MSDSKSSLAARFAAWRQRRVPKEKDRPLHVLRHVSAMLLGCATLLAFTVAARFPGAVETIYTDHVGQRIGRMLGWVSSFVPFSVAETLLVAIVGAVLGSCGIAAYHVVRGRRRIVNALARGALRLGALAGILVTVFYTGWGFNYARADLVHRMHWQDLPAMDTPQLATLCEELVAVTNEEYVRAMGSEDCGAPSAPPQSLATVDSQIDAAYVRVAERLHLHPTFAVSRGRAKPILMSFIMSRLLILGFYSPWTGEANYNRETPASRLPEVIGHEKAHQRGITSEDEANFFGFMVCASSDDPYLRYSGYAMAERQLLGELLKRDHDTAKALREKIVPGVRRDIKAMDEFVQTNRGAVSKASHAVNNAYLKANRVSAGVQAYQLSAKLILAFAQTNGGTCLIPRSADAANNETKGTP